ncbi:hypothetical protein, conserved [Plasmodium gonderi]|uniref:EF-hand domain-containing protein n=1 Tax=Plasmodium gonderi TaxID=77519 RepID=A0A1Y1JGA3_PLAGO|nr:hypothetical protein, conserved [Plasmodium gonderi]GAW79114.1 hypothetical protein, conserved [Plasmodium gonderi]
MDLAFYNNDKYKLNYENEVTNKIVRKILSSFEENKQGQSTNTYNYSRKKIVDYFFEAESLFTQYDIAKSGEIDIKLFPKMARQLKQIYDARDVQKFEKEMNIKKLYKMNLAMFLTLLKRKLFQAIDDDQTFDKHFNVLDVHKKNALDLNVLKTYLGLVGDKVSPEDFDFFIKFNKDGSVMSAKSEGGSTSFDENLDPTLEINADQYRDMLTCYRYI